MVFNFTSSKLFCFGLHLISYFAWSTGALAEAKKALVDTADVQNLRNENLALFKDYQKLKEELETTQLSLAETRKSAKEQADREAESISLLQDNLEARLAEPKAVDDELLSKYSACHPVPLTRICLILFAFSICRPNFLRRSYQWEQEKPN